MPKPLPKKRKNVDEGTVVSKITIDWRDSGILSEARRQGNHDTCWALATVDCVESLYKQKFKHDIRLSAQELLNFCKRATPRRALEYIRDHGIVTEEKCPYLGEPQKNVMKPEGPRLKIKEFGKIYGLKETSSVLQSHPLIIWSYIDEKSISEMVGDNQWKIYQQVAVDEKKLQNHAFLLAGEGIEAKDGDILGYYIVKSSWGAVWGQKGFGRIHLDPHIVIKAWYPILFDTPVPEIHL